MEIINESSLTFRPERYLQDSYFIHGISSDKASTFDDKWESLHRLLSFFNKHKDGLFCCHANYSMFGNYGYFDRQVIKQVAESRKADTGVWFQQNFPSGRFISTHTLAKRLLRLKKNDLKSLANHYGIEFKHHNAKEDTEAMMKIFFEIIHRFKIFNEDLLCTIGHGANKVPEEYLDSPEYNQAIGRLL